MATACAPNAKMDLVVRTLYKSIVFNGVDANSDVAELKDLLHKRGELEHIPIPVASKQRLVFKGSVLTFGSLKNVGIRSGDHLVLLMHRSHVNTTPRPVDTTPVPTAASIRNAVIAEARRRGMENTIVDEPARAFRPFSGMARDVDQHLLQLVQALQGRPAAMEGRAGQPRQTGGTGEVGAAAARPPAEAGATGGRRYLQPSTAFPGAPQVGMMPPGMMLFGMPSPAAPAAGPPPQPPAIPEPDAQAAAQLGEMGFGEAVVRKALLLHRNDMEAALNWLLQHGDDPAAVEPLTDEQLRQIYSRGPRGPPSEPELVEQLVAMGFDRNQSTDALRRFRNMDMALAYLLRAADEGAEHQPQNGGVEGAVGAAAAAGAPQDQVPEASGRLRADDQGPQPETVVGAVRHDAAGSEGGGSGMHGGPGQEQAARGLGGGDSSEIPELALSDGENDDMEMLLGRLTGQLAQAAGGDQRVAEESDSGSQAGGGGQHLNADMAGLSQRRGVDRAGDMQHGAGEEGEDMDEDDDEDDDDEGEDDDDEEEDDEEEEEDDEDDFAGGGRAAMLHMPLTGGGLRLVGTAMPDDPMGGIRAFEGPFALYGGAPHGVGATTPAMAVTRGPDGNELVLGSAGATMPPLMPARGMMLGGLGLGGGGGLGLVAQPLDLPGLAQASGASEDELQGMGLVQQLLNAVLRDAMGGGEGAGGAAANRR
ncbi:hypothetical protein Vretimale_3822 [Volvox reticuliferus]|uniref:Uncharacterized protein n=1 Tax=Volvox reticuliferus TaxID=1737510 RepID=A0A8J4G4V3_9CHLO|nr:hypothetical protein Vretifemale_1437 [Volvox reticuliferus]GIL98442.1 hypothetical protein Vretimale_3822 [Volvox reticuliferus]